MSTTLPSPRAPEQPIARGETRRLPSSALTLEPGPFDINSLTGPGKCFGLLVLKGLITAELDAGRARVAWLVGADDLIRPWEMEELTLTQWARWRALTPTAVLPLAGELQQRAARNPEIVQRLLARAARTSHWLLANSLILSAPSIEERLLLLFALYGERWGKVTPGGIRLEMPLTHELLASLCGARRPTVTLALQSLTEQGFLDRVSHDQWVLPRDPDTNGRCRSWAQYAGTLGLDGQRRGLRPGPAHNRRAASAPPTLRVEPDAGSVA